MEHVNLNDRLHYPATFRNRDSIACFLSQYVPTKGMVLEIASGSGEHGVYFQSYFPSIIWQTSDPELVHRKSIISWIAHQGLSSKMPAPLDIDVEKRPWPLNNQLRSLIKVIVCINMIHISPWSSTKALFEASKNYLHKNDFLMLYGPFLQSDKQICDSNLNFDQSLKLQNPLWGLRNLDSVREVANKNGFEQETYAEMPANNLSVIYRLN
tara:strand:+ start:833 stop:1465 length:633 start_codon:yes stop_codon:yes gene_type:complete